MFREHGCELPANAVSSTRIRDIHKPSGACGCPPSCASRLKSQLASQRLFAPPLILLVRATGHRRRKAITNHFSTQFCWVVATIMSENRCLDCAYKNNPICKVYCLSGTDV